MSKVITSLVVAAVMLVGSSALANGGTIAGVNNAQSFTTNMFNDVTLLGGQQTADSTNYALIQNSQDACGPCLASGFQSQLGLFNQKGVANGTCAMIGLEQTAIGEGLQIQNIGDGVGAKQGIQSLELAGIQSAVKAEGEGDVSGQQTMILNQGQDGSNAAGSMDQSSFVTGMQTVVIDGYPGAMGAAGSTLLVTTEQQQAVY